jgi:hypothetical protein
MLREPAVAAKRESAATKSETTSLHTDLAREYARWEQAERDQAVLIQGLGKATREGVAEDIKKAPIKVEMNGQPIADPAKTLAVRTKLGQLLEQNGGVRNLCLASPRIPNFSCVMLQING